MRSAARAAEIAEPTERMGLSDVIGQGRVVAELRARVADAKKKPVRVIEPILLLGEAGQGKTAIAHAIAADLGTKARVILAHHVKNPSQIVEVIREAPAGSVLFIDEIHKLPDDAALALYAPLEKPSITILAATNLPEEMSHALLSRFGSHVRLGEYSEDSLTEIAKRIAGPDVDLDACRRIAKASRGTPREAVNLTKRLLAMANGQSRHLEAESVGELLALAGIDERGLDSADRKIVGVLRAAERPLALATLAAKAGIRKETLLERHEPFLLKLGLIEITLQGRVAVQN
jgi:Holliday junction DNA helicase RuvB